MVNRFPRGSTATISYLTLYPAGSRVCLSGGDPGLAQPVCSLLGARDDIGQRILPGGVAAGTGDLEARDFQHRPGGTVHERGFYGAIDKRRDQSEYGWPGPDV